MKLAKAITASFIALGASSTWAETVRELHVFLPDNATWNTSTPLIYEDGKAHELKLLLQVLSTSSQTKDKPPHFQQNYMVGVP